MLKIDRSSFSEFCQRYGKDERYKAIEKVRERESLFNEYLLDVRRREKEEKQQKKDQVRKEFINNSFKFEFTLVIFHSFSIGREESLMQFKYIFCM